jgi:cytochrome P450
MKQHAFNVLITALGLILSGSLYSCIYNISFSPLREYPGPLLWRISKLPNIFSRVGGNLHTDVLALHDQYGSVVRISPRDLSYANAAVWKDAWAPRQGHQEILKNFAASPANDVNSILFADRESHSRCRRLLSHAFSAQGLREQVPRIKGYVDLLISGISTHGKDGPTNVVEWFNRTTFFLIGDLACGQSFGCLENARTHPGLLGFSGVWPPWFTFRRYKHCT